MKQTESKEAMVLLTEWEEEAMKKAYTRAYLKVCPKKIQCIEQGLPRGKRKPCFAC